MLPNSFLHFDPRAPARYNPRPRLSPTLLSQRQSTAELFVRPSYPLAPGCSTPFAAALVVCKLGGVRRGLGLRGPLA
eukprot:scaffold1411_cov125-Isochrysis_galbana.AAC.13